MWIAPGRHISGHEPDNGVSGLIPVQRNEPFRLSGIQLARELLSQRFLLFFWRAINVGDVVKFFPHHVFGNSGYLGAICVRANFLPMIDDCG